MYSTVLYSKIFSQLLLPWKPKKPLAIRHLNIVEEVWIVVRNGALFWYKHRLSIYGEFNYKDKTVLIPSYLYNDNPYTGETASLYWSATHPKHRTQPSPIYLQTLRKLWSFHSGTKNYLNAYFPHTKHFPSLEKGGYFVGERQLLFMSFATRN